MAEIETIDKLRSSLARRREHADANLARAHQVRIRVPDLAQLWRSRPVEFVLRRPAITGLAIGAIYLIGPLRVLRLATTAAGLVQAALSARTACRILAVDESGEDKLD